MAQHSPAVTGSCSFDVIQHSHGKVNVDEKSHLGDQSVAGWLVRHSLWTLHHAHPLQGTQDSHFFAARATLERLSVWEKVSFFTSLWGQVAGAASTSFAEMSTKMD